MKCIFADNPPTVVSTETVNFEISDQTPQNTTLFDVSFADQDFADSLTIALDDNSTWYFSVEVVNNTGTYRYLNFV